MGQKRSVRKFFLRLGLISGALSAVLVAGLALTPSTVSADFCENDAFIIFPNGSSTSNCSSGAPDGITLNQAMAANDDAFFSFGAAWARAETSNASLNRPTYAWSFNTRTVLAAALAGNDVSAAGVNTGGSVFGGDGSAFAIATNSDSIFVLAVAKNALALDNVDTDIAPIQRNVFSTATNTYCLACSAKSNNDVSVENIISVDGAVSLGTIYANAVNDQAIWSSADADNSISIANSTLQGSFLTEAGNGSFASATNSGGPIGGVCFDCTAKAYNSLSVDGVLGNGGLLPAVRAVGLNEYSPGSFALGVNNVELSHIIFGVETDADAFGGQLFAYAYNTYSPDSKAAAFNNVAVGHSDPDNFEVIVDSVSNGAIWAWANNDHCYDCNALARNDVAIGNNEVDLVIALNVLDAGAYAHAFNEGPLPPGFGDNTAKAFNTIDITNTITDGNVVTNSVYSFAHNYTGDLQGPGYCYDCVAVSENKLKIESVLADLGVVDDYVFAHAENYNAEDAKALASNSLKIEDALALDGYVIGNPTAISPTVIEDASGVYAVSSNRYCDYCLAKSDNDVRIKESVALDGNIMTGDAFAWAENNLDGITYDVVSTSGGGYHKDLTAVAYNTLKIEDNVAFGGDMVSANVFSCASNNVGGGACGMGRRIISGEVGALVYDGNCIDCHAHADNFVKLTGASIIDVDAQQQNQAMNSLGGVYAYAENTAQGETMLGVCDTCTATADNTVLASGVSTVDGTTFAGAINENSVNALAIASNTLTLENSAGHAETSVHNDHSEDVIALGINQTSATDSGEAHSIVEASNTNSDNAVAIGLGLTNATDGGSATSEVGAHTGSTNPSDPVSGVAVAVGLTSADDTESTSESVADLTNDGTATGAAVSVSYDANGNVAVAAVFVSNGDGVAVSITNAIDGEANAEADADGGSGNTSGDITVDDGGDASASTSTSPAP